MRDKQKQPQRHGIELLPLGKIPPIARSPKVLLDLSDIQKGLAGQYVTTLHEFSMPVLGNLLTPPCFQLKSGNIADLIRDNRSNSLLNQFKPLTHAKCTQPQKSPHSVIVWMIWLGEMQKPLAEHIRQFAAAVLAHGGHFSLCHNGPAVKQLAGVHCVHYRDIDFQAYSDMVRPVIAALCQKQYFHAASDVLRFALFLNKPRQLPQIYTDCSTAVSEVAPLLSTAKAKSDQVLRVRDGYQLWATRSQMGFFRVVTVVMLCYVMRYPPAEGQCAYEYALRSTAQVVGYLFHQHGAESTVDFAFFDGCHKPGLEDLPRERQATAMQKCLLKERVDRSTTEHARFSRLLADLFPEKQAPIDFSWFLEQERERSRLFN